MVAFSFPDPNAEDSAESVYNTAAFIAGLNRTISFPAIAAVSSCSSFSVNTLTNLFAPWVKVATDDIGTISVAPKFGVDWPKSSLAVALIPAEPALSR